MHSDGWRFLVAVAIVGTVLFTHSGGALAEEKGAGDATQAEKCLNKKVGATVSGGKSCTTEETSPGKRYVKGPDSVTAIRTIISQFGGTEEQARMKLASDYGWCYPEKKLNCGSLSYKDPHTGSVTTLCANRCAGTCSKEGTLPQKGACTTNTSETPSGEEGDGKAEGTDLPDPDSETTNAATTGVKDAFLENSGFDPKSPEDVKDFFDDAEVDIAERLRTEGGRTPEQASAEAKEIRNDIEAKIRSGELSWGDLATEKVGINRDDWLKPNAPTTEASAQPTFAGGASTFDEAGFANPTVSETARLSAVGACISTRCVSRGSDKAPAQAEYAKALAAGEGSVKGVMSHYGDSDGRGGKLTSSGLRMESSNEYRVASQWYPVGTVLKLEDGQGNTQYVTVDNSGKFAHIPSAGYGNTARIIDASDGLAKRFGSYGGLTSITATPVAVVEIPGGGLANDALAGEAIARSMQRGSSFTTAVAGARRLGNVQVLATPQGFLAPRVSGERITTVILGSVFGK